MRRIRPKQLKVFIDNAPPLRTEFFDLLELPEPVRLALDYAAARHSPRECLNLLHSGLTPNQVVRVIIETDAYMVQHG